MIHIPTFGFISLTPVPTIRLEALDSETSFLDAVKFFLSKRDHARALIAASFHYIIEWFRRALDGGRVRIPAEVRVVPVPTVGLLTHGGRVIYIARCRGAFSSIAVVTVRGLRGFAALIWFTLRGLPVEPRDIVTLAEEYVRHFGERCVEEEIYNIALKHYI